MTNVHPAGGKHFLVEFRKCNPKQLNDKKFLRDLLVGAAEAAKCQVLHTYFHRFMPQGVTGVVVLAESHISIHSWTEYRFAALDIFMCGNNDPQDALNYIMDRLIFSEIEVTVANRG